MTTFQSNIQTLPSLPIKGISELDLDLLQPFYTAITSPGPSSQCKTTKVAPTMASTPSTTSSQSSPGAAGTILPYRMHVSQRYLELTKQKLELTRLPRDPQIRQQRFDLGVTKAEIEPLVDHWVESYNWRAQETYYNDSLPQYRLSIHGTRIHFVHMRSTSRSAIPILLVHGWPESFITASHMIEALCNPVATPPRGDENVPSFHVVVPSIPGFGFSDQTAEEGNNIATTAEVFDALMKTLGYTRYITHGSGWGFRICRLIALTHSESCIAIHTANPDVPAPGSSFPQHPNSPMAMHSSGMTPSSTPGIPRLQTERPQTISYALCDSPAGLLAYVIDAIQPRLPTPTAPAAGPSSSSAGLQIPLQNPWTPTALINWTMLYWLPGPEVALRWLINSGPMLPNLWVTHSNVPLAISQFSERNSPGAGGGAVWAEAYHRIAMVRRRHGNVRFAAWERPMEMVQDIRDLANLLGPAAFVAYPGSDIVMMGQMMP